MRISHEVDSLLFGQLREEERIEGLLGQVRVREVLRARHYICVDFIDEGREPCLKAAVGVTDLLVYSISVRKGQIKHSCECLTYCLLVCAVR